MGRRAAPRRPLRVAGGHGHQAAGGARLLLRPPRRPARDAPLLRAGGAPRLGEPGVLRLRPLERAGGHELGVADLRAERAVLLLPAHHGSLPRLAAGQARQHRALERGVVPDVQRVGAGRAAPLRDHPHVRRLHGLAGVHRREDRRRPEVARGRGAGYRRVAPRHEPRAQPVTRLPDAGRQHGRLGRLPDEVVRRLLRDELLPEADVARPGLPVGAPGPRVRHGARRDR